MSHKHDKKQAPARSVSAGLYLRLLLLSAGVLVLSLATAELFCRWNFKKNIESLAFSESDLYYYYDRAGFRHNIPNKIGYERLWNDQGRTQFRINSLGWRGPEIALAKTPGVTRILFVGDSITLGGRLPEEATFVSRVGQALGPRYETANAGVGDVGLTEEEATLHAAMVAHPDLVVLCWYLNDARPPVGFPDEIVFKNPIIRWFNNQNWLRSSYLAGFIYDRLRQSIVNARLHLMDSDNRRFQWTKSYIAGDWARNPEAFQRLADEARFDWGDAWDEKSLAAMAAKIAVLRDFAVKNGVRFAVVMLPVHAQAYAGFASPVVDQPQRELSEKLHASGIASLNLLPELRSYIHAHPAEMVFYDQCHYTPQGNQVVADAIIRFLKTIERPAP